MNDVKIIEKLCVTLIKGHTLPVKSVGRKREYQESDQWWGIPCILQGDVSLLLFNCNYCAADENEDMVHNNALQFCKGNISWQDKISHGNS